MRDAGGKAAFAVVGAIVGALVVLAADSATRAPDTASDRGDRIVTAPEPKVVDKSRAPKTGTSTLLVWSPRSLPGRTEELLEGMRGVRNATRVVAALDWIRSSRAADGTELDPPRRGFAIPFEIALIDPGAYAQFVPPSERDLVSSLGPGEALLSRTSAEIRRGGVGLSLRLRDRTVRVVNVVSDEAANGYEALMTASGAEASPGTESFILVQLARPDVRSRVGRTVKRLLPPGRPLRIRSYGETPFLRYGDAVQPQLLIKEAFGEFSARPRSDGFLDMDPRWRRTHIRTAALPLIGEVTCHRALLPQLGAALVEVRDAGLSHAIDPDQFAGCYSARFINRDPTSRLSHHSWGVAADINLRGNEYGMKPSQDARLVAIMESHGFTWGGRWIIPDGMHFEWVRFP